MCVSCFTVLTRLVHRTFVRPSGQLEFVCVHRKWFVTKSLYVQAMKGDSGFLDYSRCFSVCVYCVSVFGGRASD
jgi:hypothetical protein